MMVPERFSLGTVIQNQGTPPTCKEKNTSMDTHLALKAVGFSGAFSEAGLDYSDANLKAVQTAIEAVLPDLMGSLVRRLRAHGIVLVYHDGLIEGGPGGMSADQALSAAVGGASEQGLSLECLDSIAQQLMDSLWDASTGFHAVKKAA